LNSSITDSTKLKVKHHKGNNKVAASHDGGDETHIDSNGNVADPLTEKSIKRMQRSWPSFLTIVSYLISETSKKQRSF
jgi:hypothetical protein